MANSPHTDASGVKERREMASNTHPEFLTRQTTSALKNAQGRALAAAAIHQARGAFYMAELCEKRAAEILAVLSDRAQAEAA
jgi:hypothetical protein